MKETFKNFAAMVTATIIWALGFLILGAGYLLIESGPIIEEFVFLGAVIVLFVIGVFICKKYERVKVALEFPLFPGA